METVHVLDEGGGNGEGMDILKTRQHEVLSIPLRLYCDG